MPFGMTDRRDREETANNRAHTEPVNGEENTLSNDERIRLSRVTLAEIHNELKALDPDDEHDARRADFLRSDLKAEGLHLSHLKKKRPFYEPNQTD